MLAWRRPNAHSVTGTRSRGANPELQEMEERIERCASWKEAGREIGALEVRLERATSAAARRTELDGKIAALNAPDPAVWRSIQIAGREFDEAALRVAALELRIEIVAECALAAEVLVGDPAGPTRLATGETAVMRGDGHLKIRLPGVATLDISGPSGDAAEWRGKREESGALLGRLLQPFGVATWQELVDRAAERSGWPSNWPRREPNMRRRSDPMDWQHSRSVSGSWAAGGPRFFQPSPRGSRSRRTWRH